MQNKLLKGQLSTEILILIGLVLVLLVPLLIYAYSKASTATNDLAVQKAEFDVQRLASLADSVGYLGGEAAVIDEVEIPEHFYNITVVSGTRDIVITMDSTAGTRQIVQSSNFILTEDGSLSRITKAGTYFIEVRALSNYTGGTGAAQVMLSLK